MKYIIYHVYVGEFLTILLCAHTYTYIALYLYSFFHWIPVHNHMSLGALIATNCIDAGVLTAFIVLIAFINIYCEHMCISV